MTTRRIITVLAVLCFSPACKAQEYYVRFADPADAARAGAYQPDLMPPGIWPWYHLVREAEPRQAVADSLGLEIADVLDVGRGKVTKADDHWTPNDPRYSQQGMWGQRAIQDLATRRHMEMAETRTIRVGVLDSGVSNIHPDLTRVVDGYSVIPGKHWSQDDCIHGSHVAGTICADTNNKLGVSSSGYDVEIISLKCLDWCSGSLADVTDAAVIGAVVFHCDVLNVSLQWWNIYDPWQEAMDLMESLGTVMVVASGNFGQPFPSAAARHPWIIAVGASDVNGDAAGFSNRGVDVYAPGVRILSTIVEGPIGGPLEWNYRTLSGTSMATPHVVSAVANQMSVMQGYVRNADVARDVRSRLLGSGDASELDAPYLNAARALLTVLPCVADWDQDGSLDLFDLLAFQDSFAIGDPRADLAPDGSFDMFDWLEYQAAWAEAMVSGCGG